jgi:hypothetical protein
MKPASISLICIAEEESARELLNITKVMDADDRSTGPHRSVQVDDHEIRICGRKDVLKQSIFGGAAPAKLVRSSILYRNTISDFASGATAESRGFV